MFIYSFAYSFDIRVVRDERFFGCCCMSARAVISIYRFECVNIWFVLGPDLVGYYYNVRRAQTQTRLTQIRMRLRLGSV